MPARNIIRFAGVLLLLLGLAACSSSQLNDVWKNPDVVVAGPMERVLILGLSENDTSRRSFEDEWVKMFTAAGVESVAGYTVWDKGDSPKEGDLRKAVEEADANYVLIVSVMGTKNKQVYNPPTYTTYPGSFYGGYYGHYSAYRTVVTQPGYYSNHEVLLLDISLYDLEHDKPVWSGVSSTTDPDSVRSLSKELFDLVSKELKKHGLLPQ